MPLARVVSFEGVAYTTSAGGLVAYDTTIGRSPALLDPTVNESL